MPAYSLFLASILIDDALQSYGARSMRHVAYGEASHVQALAFAAHIFNVCIRFWPLWPLKAAVVSIFACAYAYEFLLSFVTVGIRLANRFRKGMCFRFRRF